MAAVMDAARHCSQAHYLEIREKAIRYIVNQMDRYLLAQREYRTGCMVRIKHVIAKFCCVVGGRSTVEIGLGVLLNKSSHYTPISWMR
jgi:innexin